MEEKTFKIVSFCDIPENLTEGSYLEEYNCGSYVPFTLFKEDDDPIVLWIVNKYPELLGEEILIDMDY